VLILAIHHGILAIVTYVTVWRASQCGCVGGIPYTSNAMCEVQFNSMPYLVPAGRDGRPDRLHAHTLLPNSTATLLLVSEHARLSHRLMM